MVYRRVNMLASGKMFVANTLPSFMLAMFDWNPLFHCVDQARSMMFINYSPIHSNLSYLVKGRLGGHHLRSYVEVFHPKTGIQELGSDSIRALTHHAQRHIQPSTLFQER